MGHAGTATFVPVLTVMAEHGCAPFLWVVDHAEQRGVGSNWCDGVFWDESFPMSEGLWRKFADWANEFDSMPLYDEAFRDDGWDWPAFNARGLQLSRWLKEDVGAAYRVVYQKPSWDPNHRIDERTEILTGGMLMSLPSFRPSFPGPRRFCRHIVSGGQTGADRGALDFAIRHGYTHGGWAPHGRQAEDGVIPFLYQLMEMPEGGYRQRTRRNVADSDATLVVNLGELDGGTLAMLGAGTAIPSVRHFSQRIIHQHGGRLIRINPGECGVPSPRDVGLRAGAAQGLAALARMLANPDA